MIPPAFYVFVPIISPAFYVFTVKIPPTFYKIVCPLGQFIAQYSHLSTHRVTLMLIS